MKLRLFEKICRDIVEKEKSDKPPMMALAWTEPLVGSDNLQKELIPGARIGCEAKAVDGGWVLNGTKCFISSGSISAYHVAIMPVDRKRPLETITGFLVPTETKGFSFGRDEHKMGMKATPASMMIYEDCYLPDEYRLTPVGGMANIYNVIGFGLVVVGAMAAGVARGAYERAVTFAREHKVREKLLINHEWAQIILAEMLMNVLAARAVYMDAAFCSLNCGFGQLVPPRRGGFRFKLLAEILLGTELMKKVADNEERFYRMMGWAIDRFLDTPQEHGFGALAKVKCSDYAVTNSNLGIDLMGKAGLRHDYGMEKIYRDAKLLQIYEATNELNRMVLFNRLIRQEEPGIEMFGGGCNG
jgi:acyl-CoA dehydrogenase